MKQQSESQPTEITISPDGWSKVDHPTRLFYLQSCRANLKRVAPFWVEEEAELRGHSPDSAGGAESWLLGPLPLARMLRYLENGLQSGGRPRVASHRLRIDGRSISRIFPYGLYEALLFWGTQAYVWSVGSELQGQEYRDSREEVQGPALVLGASNVSSICTTDVLSKLFCENRPVVCKVPPRFEALMPIFNEVFYPLVRDRHVQFVCGGADLGRQLVSDPIFDTVHLTGAASTFQALTQNNTFPERTFTAELGCVTPAIVVPGKWSTKEIQYQARHLVSVLTLNGGYNCVTPQILVLSKDWPHKEAFLTALREQLSLASQRDDHFPGAPERRVSFRESYPEGEQFGPRTLVKLDHQADELLFREESFCGMLGWVELEETAPDAFLAKAVPFCNSTLWGDLSCLMLLDPATRRTYEREVAQALTGLEFGTVSVNVWTGVAFGSCVIPWGSYRGGRDETGRGWVHNTFFFDRPEKTVMKGDFVPPVPQPWLKPFPGLYNLGKTLFELDLEPSLLRLLRLTKAYASSLWKLFRRVPEES